MTGARAPGYTAGVSPSSAEQALKAITLYFVALLIGPMLVFLGIVLDSWWHFEREGKTVGPFHPLGDPLFYLGLAVMIVATIRMFFAHISLVRASSSGASRVKSIRTAVISLYVGIGAAALTLAGCFLDLSWHDRHSKTLEVFSPLHPYHPVVLAGFVLTIGAGLRLLTSSVQLSVEAEEAGRPRRSPAGLQTILFTDMEGSTTLTQRLGDAKAQELLRAHNTIVRDALRAHGGSEIKQTGDGIMASFPSASRAIDCAIAIQRALAAYNQGEAGRAPGPEPPVPLLVRIGLNAGEPVAEDEDLFGTAVQLAARICAQAEPGAILVSDVVRQLAAGKGFLFSDQGDVALDGFEDPVRLYEVRWER